MATDPKTLTARDSDINEKNARILIVEDDRNIHRLVKRALERAGMRVTVAETAAGALEVFNSARPELILLDVMLPDGSGFNLCRKLRKDYHSETPVIFMTLKHDLDSRLEGFDTGGQDFIPKPFHIDELLKRVSVHLRAGRSRGHMAENNYRLLLKDNSRLNMIDMIVHDLKMPLTAVMSAIKMVKDQHLVADVIVERLMRSADRASEAMLLMIGDILDISKSEQGRLAPKAELVPIAAVLEEVLDLFEFSCSMRAITCKVKLPGGGLTAITDRRLLFRILANYVSNALKCSREDGEILIECVEKPASLHFAVSDHGPGIPDDEKTRIFGKYTSAADTDARFPRGYGIGLFFCRSAAESMKGMAWVEDRPGGGSRFVLSLPTGRGEHANENQQAKNTGH